jgi:lipid-A-disaccharide synthase
LLLFPFEKQYFEKENINCTFVGHPFLEDNKKNKIDIRNVINEDKKIISIFSGSRSSEINVLTPILLKFIKMVEDKYNDIHFIFHTTNEHRETLKSLISKEEIKNCDVISDEKIKSYILKKSTFAVAKSGTISLEICNANVPSIIIYKINFINFFILKMLVKVKFANIVNITAGKEIIPELLQEKCNAKNIFNKVDEFLTNPDLSTNQINQFKEIIKDFKTDKSSNLVSTVLINSL